MTDSARGTGGPQKDPDLKFPLTVSIIYEMIVQIPLTYWFSWVSSSLWNREPNFILWYLGMVWLFVVLDRGSKFISSILSVSYIGFLIFASIWVYFSGIFH